MVMAYDLHLADRVRSILARGCDFSERKMFGGLAFMVNGRMTCGVLKTDLVLHLTPEQAATSLRQPYARPMDFTGKALRSMTCVSAPGTDSDQALTTWVETAAAIARSLPVRDAVHRAGGWRPSQASSLGPRKRAIARPAPRKKLRQPG
jgi:hypothetical protein